MNSTPSARQTTKQDILLRRSVAIAAGLTLVTTGGIVAPAVAAPSQAADTYAAADTAQTSAEDAGTAWDEQAYRGSVHVEPGSGAAEDTLDGTVFDDLDQDSRQDSDEPGIEGVQVSNGRDIVTTDAEGDYELPAFDHMTVHVTQPSGYQVPMDDDNVAQFFYNHSPEGSPDLRYGGIEPTGPLPEAVNFPLSASEATASSEQHCVIGGDIQTYDKNEVEYARAGAFADLAQRDDYAGCGALFVGDNVGDDLSLYPDVKDLASMLNGPARFLPGNHDLDFDALEGKHEFDTYRSHFGPEYYSYDAGDTHVVTLSNIQYPTQVPAAKGDYTEGIDEQQMEWLRQDIANTPADKAIVIASHAPLADFQDTQERVDGMPYLQEIYEILEGREVTAVSGHMHRTENLREGDRLAAWENLFGEQGLPFTHLTVGAISGDWYSGRQLEGGYPTALQGDGGVPGVVTLDIDGTEVVDRFTRTNGDNEDQMSLSLNTPAYREWYEANIENGGEAEELENPNAVPAEDLGETWLTTNFWMGSTGSTVEVSVDGGEPAEAERTQQMLGEERLTGAEVSDPAAVQEQLVHGGSPANSSMHIWRLPLPADLEAGEHTAEVTATDVHGREFTETLSFTVGGSEGGESGGDIPVEAEVPGLPGDGGNGEDGALVMSVTPGSAELQDAETAGDRVAVAGVLPTVAVTDTRAEGKGWELSGQAGDLSAGEAEITASHLGWSPAVVSSTGGATAGEPVDTELSGGTGLAEPALLGAGDAETRRGTSEFGADLLLEVPVDTEEGSYSGNLSMSLFPID
ncbi:calcineurin-like phosphoesterase C-terminal domain-containing protein [Citricoccus parietis]|uniref:Calcineurin-like phosphoesterase C-terminal domain-containing protein n=2 Tax=Citricoccus parietis TaxID=592307 RepID=A0ABV6F976_9MICC